MTHRTLHPEPDGRPPTVMSNSMGMMGNQAPAHRAGTMVDLGFLERTTRFELGTLTLATLWKPSGGCARVC